MILSIFLESCTMGLFPPQLWPLEWYNTNIPIPLPLTMRYDKSQ